MDTSPRPRSSRHLTRARRLRRTPGRRSPKSSAAVRPSSTASLHGRQRTLLFVLYVLWALLPDAWICVGWRDVVS